MVTELIAPVVEESPTSGLQDSPLLSAMTIFISPMLRFVPAWKTKPITLGEVERETSINQKARRWSRSRRVWLIS